MRERIKQIIEQSERDELLNKLQALTGWKRDRIDRATAGQHNEQIRYVVQRIKKDGWP